MDGMIISGGLVVGVIIVVLVLIILASCINIVPQANAYIIERLGAYIGTWSVGIHFKVPFLDRVVRRVNLKEQVMDFPPQLCFSRLRIQNCLRMVWKIRSWQLKI